MPSTANAQSRSDRFVLRALAARKLLQQRKFLRHRAAGKPVIHVCRSGNDRPKDQVADEVYIRSQPMNVCYDVNHS
jgi:hypothetical protein